MIVTRALHGCPVNARLQPGMAMPRSLQGLGAVIPVPDVIQPGTAPPKPPGTPSGVHPKTARRLQISGVLASAAFATAGLVASQQGKSELAAQLALASILAGAVVSVSQLFMMDEGY
jgi:hypothetical protein